ncbi:MAG TPA: hypothetical protein VGB79_08385 [Allosphingosinicella sp.]|jgi:hypothetical protein
MRLLLALAATLLLLPFAAAGAQPAGAGERYVPQGIWRDPEDAERREREIGRLFRAIGEPVLEADPRPYARRFRLLVIPDGPASVTMLGIDERRAGSAKVRVTWLDRARDYSLRAPAERRSYDIDRHSVLELERALAISGLVRLAPEGEPMPADYIDSNGDGVIHLCMHPTTYVFELVERGRRSYVLRDSCDMTGPLWRLLNTLDPLVER